MANTIIGHDGIEYEKHYECEACDHVSDRHDAYRDGHIERAVCERCKAEALHIKMGPQVDE
jgi:Zn finger protein HypA/HybF involved in hydrogenase expression